ncbi:hypothetical protein [Longispora albida]|uniref:hypothetical protein n=1 Tax=Longispora albida TaxID=203523 RepID=UPI00037564DF|nr:hypothetical protein [Longispora albida]
MAQESWIEVLVSIAEHCLKQGDDPEVVLHGLIRMLRKGDTGTGRQAVNVTQTLGNVGPGSVVIGHIGQQ